MKQWGLIAVVLILGCSNDQSATAGQGAASVEDADVFDVERKSFGSTVVDCRNGDLVLIDSAWAVLKKGLNQAQNPTLDEVVIKPARFKDSSGTVVRISYSFEPGDPGATSKAIDTVLVSDTCQTLLWTG